MRKLRASREEPMSSHLLHCKQIELAVITYHLLEIEPERGQNRLGNRLDLLLHIMLAIERVLHVA